MISTVQTTHRPTSPAPHLAQPPTVLPPARESEIALQIDCSIDGTQATSRTTNNNNKRQSTGRPLSTGTDGLPTSTPSAGLEHVPLNSPHAPAGMVVKSPRQTVKADPIAMLLYLRQAMVAGGKKVPATAARDARTRRGSVSSDTTAVGDEEPKMKGSGDARHERAGVEKTNSKVAERDIEAQLNAERKRRNPYVVMALILLVLLVLGGAIGLSIYATLHHGLH